MASAIANGKRPTSTNLLVQVYIADQLKKFSHDCVIGDKMVSLAQLCPSLDFLRHCLGLDEADMVCDDDEVLEAVAKILRASNHFGVSDDGKRVCKRTEGWEPKEREAVILDDTTFGFVKSMAELYLCADFPADHMLRELIAESNDGMIDVARFCLCSQVVRIKLGLEYEAAPEIYGNDDDEAEKRILGKPVPMEAVPENILKAVVDVLRTSTYLRVSEDGSKIGRKAELRLLEEDPKYNHLIEQTVDVNSLS